MQHRLVSILQRGGLAVLPTDTLYGIAARAEDKEAARRLYRLRRPHSKKPFVILIASARDLNKFDVRPTKAQKKILRALWPGPVSVVLPAPQKRLAYLHRGGKTLAFRLPAAKNLRALLRRTGPLLAPSANREGRTPAKTVAEAKKQFGGAAQMYVSAGRRLAGRPSTLLSLVSGKPTLLRRGAGVSRVLPLLSR